MIGGRTRADRAAVALGLLALAATAGAAVHAELDFRIRGWGLLVTLGLGGLAIVAGWLGVRAGTVAAGVGLLAAAVVQIVQLGGRAGAVEHGVLGGNAATFAVWLGLGVGLTVLGLTRVPGAGPAQGDHGPAARPAGQHAEQSP